MKYDYVNFFEERLRELAKEDYVLDVGGGRAFQKQMAKYKDWFANTKYETLDISPEQGANIVGDVHNLPLATESIRAILCKSVLEHLSDPKQAVGEMHRVLAKGGKLLAYTHFIYPYHARLPAYLDYFRFTEDGLRELFKNFSQVEIKKQGGYFFSAMFFVPYQQKLRFFLEPLCYFLDKFFQTEKRSTTPGFYIYATK